ncbi:MAG: protein kinase, partial [Thermoproteota archaeon]
EVNADKNEVEVGETLTVTIKIVTQDYIRPVYIDVSHSDGVSPESLPIALEQIAPSEEGYYETLKFKAIYYGINTIKIKLSGKIRDVDFEKVGSCQVTVYPRKPKLKANIYADKLLYGRSADLNIQIVNYGDGDAKDIALKNPERIEEYFEIIQQIPKEQQIPSGGKKDFQIIVSPKKSGIFKIEGLILEFKDMMDRSYFSEPISFEVHVETPQPKIDLKVSYPDQAKLDEDVELRWAFRNFGAEAKDVQIKIGFSEGVKLARGYKDRRWPHLLPNYEEDFSSFIRVERDVEKVIKNIRIDYIDIEGVQHIINLTGQEVGGDKPIKISISKYPGDKKLVEEERIFKGYKILRLVGSGRSANVYEALDKSGRTVALKIYKIDDKVFIKEIGKLVEKLGNVPYTVNVIDYGTSPSSFVVMDYYPMNLRSLIDLKIMLKDYIKVMLRVSKILAYASSIGIKHGDLKPENILIREESGKYYPAITDWGGGFTPCYAAPEVYESSGKTIMEKSDVWSYGVILYEVLTQSRLFKDPIDYVKRIKSDIRVELQQKKLERLINRCLLKDANKRPSFREIVEELSSYLVDELKSHISEDRFDRLSALEVVDAYVEQGEIAEAEEGLKRIDEMRFISKNVLLMMNKVVEFYKALLSRRGKTILSDEIKPIYQDILNLADEELREKLKKDNCSLSLSLLLAQSMIAPELYETIKLCLDRMREIIVQHFLQKI